MNRMRLPLLIAVVVIVALLLPGPAIIAAPEAPRMTGITSLVGGAPGVTLAYGAKGDAKTGMVTFVGRVYNTQSSMYWKLNRLRAKIPWNAQLVETWCALPGTAPADGPDADGWIQWNNMKSGSETSSPLCGFTVAGWDGKATLNSGWEASWQGQIPSKTPSNVGGYTDDTNNRLSVKAATVNYPFDRQTVGGVVTDGVYRVVGVDGSNAGSSQILVPSAEAFLALKARVDKLAPAASSQDDE